MGNDGTDSGFCQSSSHSCINRCSGRWAISDGGNVHHRSHGNLLQGMSNSDSMGGYRECINVCLIVLQTLVANYLIWQAAVCCIQCSIICFYLRLFGRSPLFRNLCYGMLGLCIAWWISSLVVVFASCNPVYLAWDPMLPGTCIDKEASCTGLGIAHVIFDFFILSLPIPVIWNLQMRLSNKIAVSSILLVAVL